MKTGKHQVTAITRGSSSGKMPEGIQQKAVDYNNPPTIVEALRGQDALVITMGVMAPAEQESKLVHAAAEANVPFVLPNEWSPDTSNLQLSKEMLFGEGKYNLREEIKKLGKSSYIAVSTGFWYEWSLAIPSAYGFDINNRKVTFFDDGNTKINTSTWPQVGRAVAGLLGLPISSDGKGACLNDYRNKHVYTSSFLASQQDMLESLMRVTKTKREEWTITKEPHQERYTKGMQDMKAGDRGAYVVCMYTRLFYPDGSGNTQAKYGLSNDVLGLPKENIDEATEVAVERAKNGIFGYGS